MYEIDPSTQSSENEDDENLEMNIPIELIENGSENSIDGDISDNDDDEQNTHTSLQTEYSDDKKSIKSTNNTRISDDNEIGDNLLKALSEAVVISENDKEDNSYKNKIDKNKYLNLSEKQNDEDSLALIDLDTLAVTLESLQTELVQQEICRQFHIFIRDFHLEQHNERIYLDRINEMCENNSQSLNVSFAHLSSTFPRLSLYLVDFPEQVLPVR